MAAGLWLDATGTQLGVPYPPFIGNWGPHADPLALLAIGLFAAAIALTPRLLAARTRPATIAAALFAATLILRLALNAARGGTAAWDHVFDDSLEAKLEYLPALPALKYGVHVFLDRFAETVPALPVHAAGHPPGLLLTMHYLDLTTPARLAAFCIVVGALAAPLTYALARRVLDETGARVAGGLMALAPGALLFGATSADAVYCTLGLAAAVALVSPRRGVQVAGGLLLAAASLFAWSLLAVGAWAVLYRRDLRLALIIGATLLGCHAVFAVATGFDPLGTLHATGRVYDLGIASRRPYAFWLFGSPTAFLLVLGAPIAWLAARQTANGAREALAIAAIIAISAAAGFTKAETERIWLFLAPFVCLAAAPLIRRHTAFAAALALQALAYQLLFDTVW